MTTQQENTQHLAHPTTGLTKLEKYKWLLKDQPGEFMWIEKTDLTVDSDYQRSISKRRMLDIAKEWSWAACGVLLVAYRNEEEQFYVFDGQHRMVASMQRADITNLPCLVFEFKDKESEAAAFVNANTLRGMPPSVAQFKARLYSGEKDAILIQQLCESTNRVISNSSRKRSVRCVRLLLDWAKKDSHTLISMWPLLDEVTGDDCMNHVIVGGLLYIERHLPVHKSLLLSNWRKRLLKIGGVVLIEAAYKAATFYARGGDKVWASGMLQVINKGLKLENKLELKN